MADLKENLAKLNATFISINMLEEQMLALYRAQIDIWGDSMRSGMPVPMALDGMRGASKVASILGAVHEENNKCIKSICEVIKELEE